MRFKIAVGALMTSAAFTAPAFAQQNYGSQPAPAQTAADSARQGQQAPAANAQAQTPDPNALKTHLPKVSGSAGKTMIALQKAVDANDQAAIPAALAAAQAAAQTPQDRYVIALLQLKAAATAKNNAAIAAALEAMLASGDVQQDEKYSVHLKLAQVYEQLKQTDRAAQNYQLALQANPNSVDATAGLAELRAAQGQTAEAIALLRKGIALQSAGGGRPSEAWYKRAVAIAYKSKLPQAVDLSRDWLRSYPTSEAWQNSLAIYQNLAQLDESQTLDLVRLKRATGVLTASDYFNYGDIALRKGLSGEAKAVVEEGFAKNAVKRSDPSFSQLYTLASQKTKGDRESLPAAPVASANARQTLVIGDAYYGYGDYAKAIEFYRAALSKPGADADMTNLHLGMALAMQGDSAGATAALNSVGGAHSDIAKYWLLYVSSKS